MLTANVVVRRCGRRTRCVPQVAWPNWAKDDFNDFSTHHHSIVLSGTRSKFHENASPSERGNDC
jgi:hypothetical protein